MKIKFDIMSDGKILMKGCKYENNETNELSVIVKFAEMWADKQFYMNIEIDNIQIVREEKKETITKQYFHINAKFKDINGVTKTYFAAMYFKDQEEAFAWAVNHKDNLQEIKVTPRNHFKDFEKEGK